MKVIVNIECYDYDEAQELFKALSTLPRASAWQKVGLAKVEEVSPVLDPLHSAEALAEAKAFEEAVAEVKAIADAATTGTLPDQPKRTRPSRAKAPVVDDPMATGLDPAPYELSNPEHDGAVVEALTPKTIEDVRVLAKALMNGGHNARLQAEMTKLNATRLSEIKDYGEAFAVLAKLSKEVGL